MNFVRKSSPFGIRKHPITGKLAGHGGIDLATEGTGHQVRSLAKGKVVHVGWDEKTNKGGKKTGYGRYVIVEHKDGYYSLYAHLGKDGVVVKPGDEIENGQSIAVSGNTGGSTGPHLHLEIAHGEKWQDIFKRDNKIDPTSIDDLHTFLYGEEQDKSANKGTASNKRKNSSVGSYLRYSRPNENSSQEEADVWNVLLQLLFGDFFNPGKQYEGR